MIKAESVVSAVAGVFLGLIVGWIIGSQQAGPERPGQPAAPQAAPAPAAQAPRAIDESRAQTLRLTAEQDPTNVAARVELANLYFDAERYGDAAKWYEVALRLNANDPNVSTDLGICYYYLNDPDKALAQFEQSLKADPKHAKTMLNMGVVRAFGKQDLKGAAEAWETLIQVSPESPEAQAAKRALDGLRSAHPEIGQAPAAPKGGS